MLPKIFILEVITSRCPRVNLRPVLTVVVKWGQGGICEDLLRRFLDVGPIQDADDS